MMMLIALAGYAFGLFVGVAIGLTVCDQEDDDGDQ